jgi:putative colanic acid biosynthesis acetyltransferase WcaF
MPYQDLETFHLPKGFRGRPAWFVQLWWLVDSTLFRCSPQYFYGWRAFLLKLFGARLGKGVLLRPTVRVTYPWKVTLGDFSWIGDDAVLYSLGEIDIGKNVVISQQCYVCAAQHDISQSTFDMTDKKIIIEDEVWCAARVFVAPGVRIGRGTVVGACSSVFKDLPPGMICHGNPAIPVGPRTRKIK